MDFYGKPIIDYTIEAALKSDLFCDVIVSSDNADILRRGEYYSVTALHREAQLSNDQSRVADVCKNILISGCAEKYDQFAVLYPTAPLRTAEDIKAVLGLLNEGMNIVQGAMAVTPFTHPVHQALEPTPEGFVQPAFPKIINQKSNDLPQYIVDNGSTYAYWVENFINSAEFYPEKLKTYTMPFWRSIDIDTKKDFELAKIMYLYGLNHA